MRPTAPRDQVAGPDSGPEQPYPIHLSGPVIQGFGRGSKDLGIPTANIPADGLDRYPDLETGVYYGVVALDSSSPAGSGILPAVLSIGYNPFYKNEVRSVEIHIMRPLPSQLPEGSQNQDQTQNQAQKKEQGFNQMPDFYSTKLNLLILGYIRPEYDYVSVDALIEDIRVDCEVARRSLERSAYVCYLREVDGEKEDERVKMERKWLVSF